MLSAQWLAKSWERKAWYETDILMCFMAVWKATDRDRWSGVHQDIFSYHLNRVEVVASLLDLLSHLVK